MPEVDVSGVMNDSDQLVPRGVRVVVGFAIVAAVAQEGCEFQLFLHDYFGIDFVFVVLAIGESFEL